MWVAIGLCLIQSGIFSGLNLGLLGVSKLRLEVEAEAGNRDAVIVLGLRRDSNQLLSTILWGNVGVNVLLALLSGHAMLAWVAFLFSTFVITIFGEILPQAIFSRHALRIGAFFAPMVRVYMILLWPLAKPTGAMINHYLGPEGMSYLREKHFHLMLKKHAEDEDSEISQVEGTGAANFLHLDDIPITREGEVLDPDSIIELPANEAGRPIFPKIEPDPENKFIKQVVDSGHAWVVLINEDDREPLLVLDADEFIRHVFVERDMKVFQHCHRPIIVRDPDVRLDAVLQKFKVEKEYAEDDVVDDDVILYWGDDQRRIITGSDILGRLLRGIAQVEPV